MKKHLFTILSVCGTCIAIAAQGQTSSSSTSGQSGSTSSDPSTSSTYQHQPGGQYGATGRMGHQDVRATKIIGAEVKSSQGQTVGTINDVILNPASGRIEFAVLSFNPTAGTETATTTTTPPSTTPSSSTSSSSSFAAGKLVAVPWHLLRASGGGYGATSTASTTSGQETFMFAGDSSKLQSTPSFDQSNWPDITQPAWRQSIFSHFGMSQGYSTGGATSPGGTESNTGSSTSPSSSSQQSTSPDSSDSSTSKPPQ